MHVAWRLTKKTGQNHGTKYEYKTDHFPILKGVGKLAHLKPIIVVDSREQAPLPISRFTCQVGTLRTGDYSFCCGEESFAVERKSIGDLVSYCVGENRERFERELHRLRGYHFARLLVVGKKESIQSGEYRSRMEPRAVLATLNAFEARYNVPVVFSPDPETAAKLVESWSWWVAREMVESVNQLWRGTHGRIL